MASSPARSTVPAAQLQHSYDSFHAEEFLRRRFVRGNELSEFLLQHLATFYSDLVNSGLKVLDYGCGPSLAYSISAAPKAAEIVLADYGKSNRDSLQKWLSGDISSGFDWTPTFQYVVQTLEGGTEEEAKKREDELRRKVKAVVYCDMTKSEFIDEHYKGPYDIVMSFLCLEVAAGDDEGYKAGIAKLTSLLKAGGHLLLYCAQREAYFGRLHCR